MEIERKPRLPSEHPLSPQTQQRQSKPQHPGRNSQLYSASRNNITAKVEN